LSVEAGTSVQSILSEQPSHTKWSSLCLSCRTQSARTLLQLHIVMLRIPGEEAWLMKDSLDE